MNETNTGWEITDRQYLIYERHFGSFDWLYTHTQGKGSVKNMPTKQEYAFHNDFASNSLHRKHLINIAEYSRALWDTHEEKVPHDEYYVCNMNRIISSWLKKSHISLITFSNIMGIFFRAGSVFQLHFSLS